MLPAAGVLQAAPPSPVLPALRGDGFNVRSAPRPHGVPHKTGLGHLPFLK